jgi:hypothetical protein
MIRSLGGQIFLSDGITMLVRYPSNPFMTALDMMTILKEARLLLTYLLKKTELHIMKTRGVLILDSR